MKSDIIQFYADRVLHVPKMIARRPGDLTIEQVEMAAEKVYHEIHAGLKIKIINIVRYVYMVAKMINSDAYIQEQKMFEDCKKGFIEMYNIIDSRNATIKEYNSNIRRLNTIMLTYSSIAAALAVGLVIQEVLCIL